jgi:hypothetical protein
MWKVNKLRMYVASSCMLRTCVHKEDWVCYICTKACFVASANKASRRIHLAVNYIRRIPVRNSISSFV